MPQAFILLLVLLVQPAVAFDHLDWLIRIVTNDPPFVKYEDDLDRYWEFRQSMGQGQVLTATLSLSMRLSSRCSRSPPSSTALT